MVSQHLWPLFYFRINDVLRVATGYCSGSEFHTGERLIILDATDSCQDEWVSFPKVCDFNKRAKASDCVSMYRTEWIGAGLWADEELYELIPECVIGCRTVCELLQDCMNRCRTAWTGTGLCEIVTVQSNSSPKDC